jgi:hypothetical protein
VTPRRATTIYRGAAIAARVGRAVYYHIPDGQGAPLCEAPVAEGETRRDTHLHAPFWRLCGRCVQRWQREQGLDVRDAWKEAE